MPDFVEIARAVWETADLDQALLALDFQLVIPLVKKRPTADGAIADYASEIWLRKEEDHYLAVRIDWMGHPTVADDHHGRVAHMHFESFPERALDAYLCGPAAGVVRYDTISGLPSTDIAATHGRIRVLPPEDSIRGS